MFTYTPPPKDLCHTDGDYQTKIDVMDYIDFLNITK